MGANEESGEIQPEAFRRVLGHHPTGVVLVTAIVDGRPIGMVVGSFTSVSLAPPLVAYLPARTSKTFAVLGQAERFCVNVLAADQVDVCREISIAGSSALESLPWAHSPSGSPILEGVVAWIDCTREQVIEAGDHYIVIGQAQAMGVLRDTLPLLFFQGGYGKFSTGSLVTSASSQHLVQAVSAAMGFEEELAAFARHVGCEVSVLAQDGDEAVFIASASAPGIAGTAPLGARLPVSAPAEALFVSPEGPVTAKDWVSELARNPTAQQQSMTLLDRVQSRGWSVAVATSGGLPDVDQAVLDFAARPRTPVRDRDFLSTLVGLSLEREPERIDDGTMYEVLKLSVRVPVESGRTSMVLKLGQLPCPASGAQIQVWAELLKDLAERFASTLRSGETDR